MQGLSKQYAHPKMRDGTGVNRVSSAETPLVEQPSHANRNKLSGRYTIRDNIRARRDQSTQTYAVRLPKVGEDENLARRTFGIGHEKNLIPPRFFLLSLPPAATSRYR